MWMNEMDVQDAQQNFDPAEVPNLAMGAFVLGNLVDWTNSNSDGWPYWNKPAKAADVLMNLLQEHTYAARFGHYQGSSERLHDVSEVDLMKALRPIKAFLTRQGVRDTALVIP